ncbi:MAG TPA: type VI secretion system tube protein Hcp [Gaiellaceae bacterium]|nr:type VI secretion system tube protein Hcp [Gaiellaceae bacterium]
MAYDAFLKLDGIDGEVSAAGYEKWIEVFSFSWGASNAGTSATGGGGGAGKASFQDLHFTTGTSKASPLLFMKCATGEHIPSGLLYMRKAGGDANGGGNVFLKYELEDILVSSFQQAGAEQGDDRPVEDVSLNFVKIDFLYTGAPDGTTVEAGWDVRANGPFAP